MRIIAVCEKHHMLILLINALEKTISPETELKGFLKPLDAVQYARCHLVDVAFVDLDMKIPLMHGLFLAKNLKEINPEINLVFISESDEYVIEAWNIHASDFLRKPVTAERIAQAMARLRYQPGYNKINTVLEVHYD